MIYETLCNKKLALTSIAPKTDVLIPILGVIGRLYVLEEIEPFKLVDRDIESKWKDGRDELGDVGLII